MSDYIPRNEAEKVNWLMELALWLDANGLAHGFTQQQIDDFHAMATDSDTAYASHRAAQSAARSATVNKNEVIGGAVAIARDYVQKLQHDLSMTDAERAAAGITVPDATKSPTAPEAILEILPPLLLLDFSICHQVTIPGAFRKRPPAPMAACPRQTP